MRPLLALLCTLAAGPARAAAAAPLPAFGAQPGGLTVSGLSSGGYMAVQFHVAHSTRVAGAGVLAAGPYDCAQGSVWRATSACMSPGRFSPLPPPERLQEAAEARAAQGAIDPVQGLAGDRVWLFTGTRDDTVVPAVVDALAAFYRRHVPEPGLQVVRNVPAGHGMVTGAGSASDVACGATRSPYLNPCGYDAAGALLAHLYGPPAAAPAADAPSGRLVTFDQDAFAGGNAYALSLADTGFLYVPAACERAPCRVHVVFHGCRQGVDVLGERFVREAGYNRWADAHRLLVLYPQARVRYGPGWHAGRFSHVFNPRGCWDWWGYTDAAYATREGPQVRAVQAMVERLTAPRSAP